MRVSNFSAYNYNIPHQKERIFDLQKQIQNNGIEYNGINGVTNTLKKLQRDDTTSMLSSQIKSLESIKNNMNLYDVNTQSMKSSVQHFNELMIKRENASLNNENISAISEEMKSISNFIKSLENDNLNNTEKLYNKKSELVVGDNIKMTRSYSSDFIKVDNELISDLLYKIAESPTTNSADNFKIINNINNKINTNLVKIGSNSNNADNLIKNKNLLKSYEDKFFSSLGSVEEKISEYNEAIKTYEASMLMINKVKDLSLVNYLK